MNEPNDRELVVRTRNGELSAYGEMVQRYQSSVFNVCYRLLGNRDDAEDLTQETFIRAYRKLDTFDEQRAFGPWIRRVAANLCYNHIRKQKDGIYHLEEERDRPMRDTDHSPEGHRITRETQEVVRAAIIELPPNYRAVIELRHYQELSYAEIAQTLEIPMSDVKSHLFRARRLLAKRLSAYVQSA